MAVTSVLPRWSDRRRDEETGRVEQRLFYTVTVDDPADTESAVLAGAGLPQYNDQYASEQLYVARRTANPADNSRHLWIAEIVYRSPPGQGGSNQDDPTLLPAVITKRTLDRQEPVDRDINNDPIVNTALAPYTDMAISVADLELTVAKNFSASQESFWGPLIAPKKTVNVASYKGYPAGRSLLWNVSEDEFETYVRVTLTFLIKLPNWHEFRLSAGRFELAAQDMTTGAPTWRLITDQNGDPVNEPVLLDADGQVAAPGDEVEQEFTLYPDGDHSVLDYT